MVKQDRRLDDEENALSTTVGIGLEEHRHGQQAGRGAARAAAEQLGGAEVTLALLFTSHKQPAQVLKGICEVLGDVPLIGATSAGEYTHQGYVEGGAGVMLIHAPQVRFHPMAHRRRWFRGSRLLGELNGLSEDGLGSDYHHRALILFPDDQSMNLDGVVTQAMTETAMLYDILGGPGPSIPKPPRAPAVFHNQRMIRSGMVGAEVLGVRPFGLALANGWTPVSGPYRVTEIEKRAVVKIDGRPAREVYEDFFYEQSVEFDESVPQETLLRHPIGVCVEGTCKVSVAMEFDQRGALKVTSPPAEQSLVHILGTEATAMSTAAERVIKQALEVLDQRTPAGLLFIDCMSTAMVLGQAYTQQRDAVRSTLGEVPFLGFRSHGVLARLQGQTSGHYECSVATWMFPE
jgi:hypothetical protein